MSQGKLVAARTMTILEGSSSWVLPIPDCETETATFKSDRMARPPSSFGWLLEKKKKPRVFLHELMICCTHHPSEPKTRTLPCGWPRVRLRFLSCYRWSQSHLWRWLLVRKTEPRTHQGFTRRCGMLRYSHCSTWVATNHFKKHTDELLWFAPVFGGKCGGRHVKESSPTFCGHSFG